MKILVNGDLGVRVLFVRMLVVVVRAHQLVLVYHRGLQFHLRVRLLVE